MKYKKISGDLLSAFEDLEEAGPTALALHARSGWHRCSAHKSLRGPVFPRRFSL